MKTFTSMARQTQARWILIYGVLIGLFFSGGEGIRLMPFPEAEGRVSRINASAADKNSKSYAFSVFNSRSAYTLLKSKFQKDPHQNLPGDYSLFERPDARPAFRPLQISNLQENDLPRLSTVSDSRSNRAPPAI